MHVYVLKYIRTYTCLLLVEDVDAGKKTKFRGVTMVTKELYESEEEYVYCLGLLVNHYLKELDHSPHRPDFIVERKGEVFGNTEEVYAVHKKLLEQLRQAKGTEQICRCFLQMVCVCACVRTCVRTCVRACVCVAILTSSCLHLQEMQFRVYINYLKIVSHGWKTLTLFGGTFFDDVKRSKHLDFPMIECYNRTFHRLEQYCRMFKVTYSNGHVQLMCMIFYFIVSCVCNVRMCTCV